MISLWALVACIAGAPTEFSKRHLVAHITLGPAVGMGPSVNHCSGCIEATQGDQASGALGISHEHTRFSLVIARAHVGNWGSTDVLPSEATQWSSTLQAEYAWFQWKSLQLNSGFGIGAAYQWITREGGGTETGRHLPPVKQERLEPIIKASTGLRWSLLQKHLEFSFTPFAAEFGMYHYALTPQIGIGVRL